MGIWFANPSLDKLQQMNAVNMLKHLDIQVTKIGDDFLCGTMPVDERTHQPFGILHGGASVVLAESLGSIAANLTLDNSKAYAVGQEVNANHLRPVSEGRVTGTARAIHMGRTTQVWEIRIENEAGKLVCISRLTMAVIQQDRSS